MVSMVAEAPVVGCRGAAEQRGWGATRPVTTLLLIVVSIAFLPVVTPTNSLLSSLFSFFTRRAFITSLLWRLRFAS